MKKINYVTIRLRFNRKLTGILNYCWQRAYRWHWPLTLTGISQVPVPLSLLISTLYRPVSSLSASATSTTTALCYFVSNIFTLHKAALILIQPAYNSMNCDTLERHSRLLTVAASAPCEISPSDYKSFLVVFLQFDLLISCVLEPRSLMSALACACDIPSVH